MLNHECRGGSVQVTACEGQTAQASIVFRLQGLAIAKLARAEQGDIVAIAEAGVMQAGQIFGTQNSTAAV